MAILIKNMEMPQSCYECILSNECACMLSGNTVPDYWTRFDRPAWCELIELPPHGRLIDADALIRQMNQKVEETNNVRYAWVDEMDISLADTIIEREE